MVPQQSNHFPEIHFNQATTGCLPRTDSSLCPMVIWCWVDPFSDVTDNGKFAILEHPGIYNSPIHICSICGQIALILRTFVYQMKNLSSWNFIQLPPVDLGSTLPESFGYNVTLHSRGLQNMKGPCVSFRWLIF